MAKPKPADIEGLTELLKALQFIVDTSKGALEMGRAVQVSVDYELEVGRQTVRKHLERTDLRPKAFIKQLGKTTWHAQFNDSKYLLGFRKDFAELDEEEPKCYWQELKGENNPDVFLVTSMFQALMAVVLHFCNESQTATGPVINPIDNSPT